MLAVDTTMRVGGNKGDERIVHARERRPEVGRPWTHYMLICSFFPSKHEISNLRIHS
jgi:hypothetical protein